MGKINQNEQRIKPNSLNISIGKVTGCSLFNYLPYAVLLVPLLQKNIRTLKREKKENCKKE